MYYMGFLLHAQVTPFRYGEISRGLTRQLTLCKTLHLFLEQSVLGKECWVSSPNINLFESISLPIYNSPSGRVYFFFLPMQLHVALISECKTCFSEDIYGLIKQSINWYITEVIWEIGTKDLWNLNVLFLVNHNSGC